MLGDLFIIKFILFVNFAYIQTCKQLNALAGLQDTDQDINYLSKSLF